MESFRAGASNFKTKKKQIRRYNTYRLLLNKWHRSRDSATAATTLVRDERHSVVRSQGNHFPRTVKFHDISLGFSPTLCSIPIKNVLSTSSTYFCQCYQ